MKKYLLFLVGVCFVLNAYGEGVVLSDTSVSDDDVVTEEPFVAPQTTNAYPSSQTENYVSQQIKPATKSLLLNDTSDPLFLIPDNKFLSDTYVFHVDRKLRVGQYIGYGINNNFVIHANMHYQVDFSGHDEHGFSATEFGGVYRMSHGFNQSHIISDALFGLKLWGSSHVRTPEYADSSYYAGLRFGRQFTGVTLSGTVKSTWVFDDERGLSYIDFIPEAYFRFKYDWRAGIGFDFRKSTNTHLMDNQEWLNLKLLRQYGNTQYVGHFDYEFDTGEVQVGADIKILF
jgi:hypothetical protein